MKKLTYRAIIQKDDRGFHGFVPALPGCHTYGQTIEKVRANIQEAITGWIKTNQSQGWDIPQDQSKKHIHQKSEIMRFYGILKTRDDGKSITEIRHQISKI